MSIQVATSAVFSPGSGQTFTPSAPQAGDVLLVWATSGSTGSVAITSPAGRALTQLGTWPSGTSSPDNGYLYYYTMQGDETTITMNFNGVYAVVAQMRGARVDTTQTGLVTSSNNAVPAISGGPSDGAVVVLMNRVLNNGQSFPSDLTNLGYNSTGTAPMMMFGPGETAHATFTYDNGGSSWSLSGAFFLSPKDPLSVDEPWGTTDTFNTASLSFAPVTNVQKIKLFGSSAYECHTHSVSGVDNYIQVFDVVQNQWVTVWHQSNGTSGTDFYLNGLEITLPYIMTVSGVQFTANQFVNQNYHGFSGSKVRLERLATQPLPVPVATNINWNGYTLNPKPKFFFSVSTPNAGATITNFEVQISSHVDFSTIDYWDAQVGVSNGTITLPSGSSGTVVCQVTTGNPLPPGIWHIRGRVQDSTGVWSDWSVDPVFTVKAPPWNDAPNGDTFQAQWIDDLYNVIENARGFRGLVGWGMNDQAAPYSPGNLGVAGSDILATHLIERRKWLQDVLDVVGVTPTWTDDDLTELLPTTEMVTGTNAVYFDTYAPGDTPPSIQSVAVGWRGLYSIVLTCHYAAANVVSLHHMNHPATGIQAGQTYTFSVMVKMPAGKSFSPVLWWTDNVGNRTQSSGPSYTGTGDWQKASITAVAPANVVSVYGETYLYNAINGDQILWNTPHIVKGNPATLDRKAIHITELRNYCLQT